ncbi:MAG: dihydroxy-acid dehydratase [Conexivisphaerales archaeon]
MQWKAIGIRDEDFFKPKIAVVNSSSNLSVCYIHLDDVSKKVQEGIRQAGGLPFEIRTTAPSDAITSVGKNARYILPSRDLIVNDIEVMVEGALLDGMVCLSSCDKTTPAHLMAAARLNIPTIIVPCGYQLGGYLDNKEVDWQDVYEAVGAYKKSLIELHQLQRMTDVAVCGPGVCPGLGTANTMHMVAEALGMTLPGNSPIRAGSDKLFRFAYEAGQHVVKMVERSLLPRDVITPKSIENAVRLVQAIGGSVNVVRHLAAIATEAELDFDVVSCFERCAEDTYQLTSIRPNGKYRIEDLERAGGTLGVLKQLQSKINLDALTIAGLTVGELLSNIHGVDEEIIRPLDRPYKKEAGLTIVRGNLAPDGAIVKNSGVPQHMRRFRGPAKVYESEEEAFEHIRELKQGDVVILRGLGPKGGPGTVFAASFVASLNGAGLAEKVAVVTDGELSGELRGLTIGQVMPEAAEGGPLAIVENGDIVSIDLDKKRVDIMIGEDQIKERLSKWKPKQLKMKRSWLSIYAEVVQPISKGAVLGKVPG